MGNFYLKKYLKQNVIFYGNMQNTKYSIKTRAKKINSIQNTAYFSSKLLFSCPTCFFLVKNQKLSICHKY